MCRDGGCIQPDDAQACAGFHETGTMLDWVPPIVTQQVMAKCC